MPGNTTPKQVKKPEGAFMRYASKESQQSSDSGQSDLGRFANWVYQKATSHPIGQIEDTLNTGKPPEKKK